MRSQPRDTFICMDHLPVMRQSLLPQPFEELAILRIQSTGDTYDACNF